MRYCLALHEGSASEKSGYLTMTTSKIVLGREGETTQAEFKSREMVLSCEYSVVVEEAEA